MNGRDHRLTPDDRAPSQVAYDRERQKTPDSLLRGFTAATAMAQQNQQIRIFAGGFAGKHIVKGPNDAL